MSNKLNVTREGNSSNKTQVVRLVLEIQRRNHSSPLKETCNHEI